MISRIIIPLILIVLLTDAYIYCFIIKRFKKGRKRGVCRTLWLMQSLALIVYALTLALEKNFAPADATSLNVFLILIGVWMLPKVAFAVCHILGWGHCAYHKTTTNWGTPVGIFVGIVIAAITVYGYVWGFGQLKVRHVTFVSQDLPKEYDGYRIVHFSDAHVGTYSGSRQYLLKAAVDSIMKEHADMIVFTGDLQNMQPSEVVAKESILSKLHAADGVFSILGNHDYAYYLDADAATRQRNLQEMKNIQQQMGWTLLCNENRILHRGSDSIVVAGMEYEGNSKKVPNFGDIRKTLRGIRKGSFVLMLQHDPTSWETDILPHSSAQLTLSGHTPAGQMKFFGWSPVALMYHQWSGLYYNGKRAINVSDGIGGFVPFRFWCPGEITVIELRCR